MASSQSGAALLAILAFLAGCAGQAPDVSTTGPSDGTSGNDDASGSSNAGPEPGAAPAWSVGDWWTYDARFPASNDELSITIVVHREDAGNYYLTADSRKAGELAEFGHYPTLGAWTKADLQPTIHGDKIPFFKFPLADGKTWSDPYRKTPATWKATQAGDAFDIELTVQDGQSAKYTYDRSVGWFTKLEYGFGTPAAILTLTANGHNYTGKVSVLTFKELVHGPYPVLAVPPAAAAPSPQNPATSIDVGAAPFLLWGFYYGGAPGAYEFSLHPQQGFESQGVEHHPQTTDANARFLWGEIAGPRAGSWGLLSGGASQGSGFTFAEVLEVHEAS